jgi:hypothetical protein
MKSTILSLFLIFTLNSPAMAQENTDSILLSGFRKPLEYSINNEEISDIKYLEIREREGGKRRNQQGVCQITIQTSGQA